MKIGFFDSGLGGLTILKAVIADLPNYDYEFYGDTANLPYGDKTEGEIYELTKKGMEYLFNKDCSLIIVACNTASAETLRKLQTTFLTKNYPDKKILGVIIPTIEAVLESKTELISIIGTNRTIASKKYELEFSKLKNNLSITSIATPELVPLIEDNRISTALKTATKALKTETGDRVVVLGCTHYTILKDKLRAQYKNEKMIFLSQDEIIPAKLKSYLDNHPEIESKLTKSKSRNIYLTKHNRHYDKFIKALFK